MLLQKHNLSMPLLQKIQLLQLNTSRVYNQHQQISRLLSDPSSINRYRQHISHVNKTAHQIQALKTNCSKLAKYIESNNRTRMPVDSRLQSQYKQLNTNLYKLKQQIFKHKHQLSVLAKNAHTQIGTELQKTHKQNIQQIQVLRKNVYRYLQKTKQQELKKRQQKILQYVNSYMGVQYLPYCYDIQADIGMAMCELQYYAHIQTDREDKVNLKQKVQNIQHKYAGMQPLAENKTISLNQLKQLELGHLEQEQQDKYLRQFYQQTQQRLIYDLTLLHHKIQMSIQCIEANSQIKHKRNNLINKYQKQLLQYKTMLSHSEYEILGMKIKIKHEQDKIKLTAIKLKALANINQQEQGHKFDYKQLNQQHQICKQLLAKFTRLKAQFVCQC